MSSSRSVPERLAAMAKSPIGVSFTTKWLTWPMVPGQGVQGIENALLALHPDEGQPDHDAEEDDRGDHVVGDGVEGVGGDVQGEEVEGLRRAAAGWC